MTKWLTWSGAVGIGAAALATFLACGSSSNTDGGGSGNGDDASANGDADVPPLPTDDSNSKNYACPGCPAFPPLGAPACDPMTLGPATIAYPLDGLLLPPNMNVLEVQFVPPANATLFEVDFYNAITKVKVETKCDQVPDVRGGTSRGCGVTLPQGAWNDIANGNRDGNAVGVTVRATIDGKCVSASTTKVDLSFAKEDLAGGIYYWQSATFGGVGGKTGGIYSHDFGSFDPKPVPFYTSGATGTCVGCHTLSRDGARMSLMTDDPDGDDEFGDVHTHLMDVATRTVLGGKDTSAGFQTFTHDHAKYIASTFKAAKGTMPDTAFDVFDGNTGALLGTMPTGMLATHPDLSRDDASLVFVSPAPGTIDKSGDHHFKRGSLFTASFDAMANTMGAPTSLLPAGTHNYFYPTFAPDKSFVAFNDAPDVTDSATANGDAFYNRNARVKLLHFPGAAGATPIDLPNLNVADGLTNSWPRWSPFVTHFHGRSILWVTFSSNRDYGLHLVNKGFDNCYPPEGPAYDQPAPLSKQGVSYANCAQPQIWMAGVIVDTDPSVDKQDRSYPAFWLPFQDVSSHNHSAQWVEKVLGGGGQSGDAGGGCAAAGQTCGSVECCADTVCCNGMCQGQCIK